MSIEQSIISRATNSCEVCQNNTPEHLFTIHPDKDITEENTVYVCSACHGPLSLQETFKSEDWTFIAHSIWSELPAVQIIAYRVLNGLKSETWAQEALDMMYLEDSIKEKADMFEYLASMVQERHRDSLGQELFDNDTVVLTKTLDVKGSTLKASLGTVIKNIRLDKNNTDYIEGKIEGQSIMILTKYLRKQNSR